MNHPGTHVCERWRGQPVDAAHPNNQCACRPPNPHGGVLLLTRQHEATDWCMPLHCEYHHVDEVGDEPGDPPSYLRCGECFHLYRTKRDLRRAFRDLSREFHRDDRLFNGQRYTDRLRGWWFRWTTRADKITYCPLCTHDL